MPRGELTWPTSGRRSLSPPHPPTAPHIARMVAVTSLGARMAAGPPPHADGPAAEQLARLERRLRALEAKARSPRSCVCAAPLAPEPALVEALAKHGCWAPARRPLALREAGRDGFEHPRGNCLRADSNM